ncbi:MAG: SUMF1/EgtB/PvdO family nonheme iron enzyme [Chitinophagales bacterium]|nr:SUMF1/EgtB/PvdO family nonheme iron enzyme [Chitinophagales bacterium]
MEIIDKLTKYFIDKSGEIIGTVLLGIGGTIFGIIIYKIKSRKEKRENKIQDHPDKSSINLYLTYLITRCSLLSFGDPSNVHTKNSNLLDGMVTLDQVWTPLRVANNQVRNRKQSSHDNMAEQDNGEDLMDVLNKSNNSIIILGDPGSGKSTSLASISLNFAKNYSKSKNKILPIWINLSSFKFLTNSTPTETLIQNIPEINSIGKANSEKSQSTLSNDLINAIIEGRALILLDGLDEVQDYNIGAVKAIIAHFCALNNGTRTIVSCRKFDYKQENPNRKIPIQQELELLPYNLEEQIKYIEGWYKSAVGIGRFNSIQARGLMEALINEVKGNDLKEIASSPMLLALLTLIHSEEAKLPDSRSVLCEKAIKLMLADNAKWRSREAGVLTTASPLVYSLSIEIAYNIHIRENNSSINYNEIKILSDQMCDELKSSESSKPQINSIDLINRIMNNHGLIINIDNHSFKFSHRSFQEFLAGQYFATGAKREEAILNGNDPNWIEPYKLMSSFAGHDANNLYYVLELVNGLLKEKNQLLSILLAGEMLVEIGKSRLILHKFSSVLSKEGLWELTKGKILDNIANSSLRLAEIERCSNILSGLGDPRFGNTTPKLIEIPEGTCNIGSDRLNEEVLKNSGAFVGEVRTINFYKFKIGKYLVTNSDFKLFIEDGGYTNIEYWNGLMSEGWIKGNLEVIERIRLDWLEKVHLHHAKEIRDGEINESRLVEESFHRTAPRQLPFYWDDNRFNQSNQPVVGINFWEAEAYCRWLTLRARKEKTILSTEKFSIPTEFEWERTIRINANDSIYPWGDTWIESKAHVSTNQLNMRQPSPVGVYEELWKNGPCDMCGNVWEWTDSIFFSYNKEFDSQRINSNSLDERVVRGSSWYNNHSVAACSARAVDRSYNLFYDVGFRIICLSESSTRL